MLSKDTIKESDAETQIQMQCETAIWELNGYICANAPNWGKQHSRPRFVKGESVSICIRSGRCCRFPVVAGRQKIPPSLSPSPAEIWAACAGLCWQGSNLARCLTQSVEEEKVFERNTDRQCQTNWQRNCVYNMLSFRWYDEKSATI